MTQPVPACPRPLTQLKASGLGVSWCGTWLQCPACFTVLDSVVPLLQVLCVAPVFRFVDRTRIVFIVCFASLCRVSQSRHRWCQLQARLRRHSGWRTLWTGAPCALCEAKQPPWPPLSCKAKKVSRHYQMFPRGCVCGCGCVCTHACVRKTFPDETQSHRVTREQIHVHKEFLQHAVY